MTLASEYLRPHPNIRSGPLPRPPALPHDPLQRPPHPFTPLNPTSPCSAPPAWLPVVVVFVLCLSLDCAHFMLLTRAPVVLPLMHDARSARPAPPPPPTPPPPPLGLLTSCKPKLLRLVKTVKKEAMRVTPPIQHTRAHVQRCYACGIPLGAAPSCCEYQSRAPCCRMNAS